MAKGAEPQIFKVIVDDHYDGERIDKVLSESLTSISRGIARKAIDFGGVFIDGKRVRRCDFSVCHGQMLEMFLDGRKYQSYNLNHQDIVFQDDYLLVINKPAGIDTQPTPSRFKGTLYYAVLQFLRQNNTRGKRPDVGMMQRLDRDTSGLILFSINQRSHKNLTNLFRERKVEKHYLAIVSGEISQGGTFDSLLARRRRDNLTVSVQRGGKRAITHYHPIGVHGGCSLVAIRLETGRSHQIRAHFSEAGYPLVGDFRYGYADKSGSGQVKRQMLHSTSLGFNHPITNLPIHCKVEPPADFSYCWQTACGFQVDWQDVLQKMNLS